MTSLPREGFTARAQEPDSPGTDLAAALARAELVVSGRVVDMVTFPHSPTGSPGICTRVTLEVERVQRGEAPRRVDFWVLGGRLGDRARRVTGQPTFVLGERVSVLLWSPDVPSIRWLASWRFGKWSLQADGTHQLEGGEAGEVAPLEEFVR